jgi:hypothetical protein
MSEPLTNPDEISTKTRILLIAVRRAILAIAGAIDTFLK